MFAGVLCLLVGAWIGSAGAGGDGEDSFQDAPGFTVTATRNFDGSNTTFTFTLGSQNGERASHVVLATCPEGVEPISAGGPDGQQPGSGNVVDGSAGAGNHTGVKFDPGTLGTYTVTYPGNVQSAQLIVKNGPGHKHFYYGAPCTDGVQATTSSTAAAATTTTAAATTTSATAAAATTTTTGEEPEENSQPESTTTTTEGPEVGGISDENSTTTTATTAPASGGTVGENTTTTVATTQTGTDPAVDPAGERAPTGVEGDTEVSPAATTLPVTGSSAASTALIWAGVALVLGGFTLRFAEARS
jgi:hypothetical protein